MRRKPMSTSPPRPNLFVVGDAKCGTSSFYRLLQLTPGVGTSTSRKELHFFSEPEIMKALNGPGDERIPTAICHSETEYLVEYASVPPNTAVIADVSPSYLQNPPAAQRIHDFAPGAKIVILLREPAAKIFSQYTHLWSEGRETLPFDRAFEASPERRAAGFSTMWDYEAGGRYTEAVQRYLTLFGPDRVRVWFFEEMFGPDPTARQQAATFLGVALPEGAPPRMNVSGRPKSALAAALLGDKALRDRLKRFLPLKLRTKLGQTIRSAVPMNKPQFDPDMRTHLRRRFATDTARLEALLGRPTGWPTE